MTEPRSTSIRRSTLAALGVVIALVTSACGTSSTSPAESSVPSVTAPAQSVEPSVRPSGSAAVYELRDPKDVALEAAGGNPIGGSVNLLGVLGGEQQDAFLAVYKPFEEATGITVEYEANRDLAAVLSTRVDGGNPPDIAATPSIGQMLGFMNAGKVINLSEFLDVAQFGQDWDSGWVDLGSVDGKLYSVFHSTGAKGFFWYNTKEYTGPNPPATWDELKAWADEKAAAGTTPFCIGLESGAATGWPATDWIENFLLKQSGPDVWDQWWKGELSWTSPEVKQAFEAFGSIALDPKMVYGGPKAELATSFLNGGDAMFTTPPQCYLHHQSDWFGSSIISNHPDVKPIDGINFFPFPAIKPQFGGYRESAGEMIAAFNDTPQVRAFMKYTVSPEAQSIIASSGQWLAPNKRVPASAYPTELTRQAAGYLASADGVKFDASDLMPEAMNAAFWTGVLNYLREPDKLDAYLAELDRVRAQEYR
jgi:alpha-glucoside transport system substrate-binding protein